MAYLSDAIIAISNEIKVDALLGLELPTLLQAPADHVSPQGHYWIFIQESIYDGSVQTQELFQFFGWLDKQQNAFDLTKYAYLRVGNNRNDIVQRGSPANFSISVNTTIISPAHTSRTEPLCIPSPSVNQTIIPSRFL